jgi:hypothetical protein
MTEAPNAAAGVKTEKPAKSMEYEFHELANVFPLLDTRGEEFGKLKEDVGTNGQREPIAIFQGKILDGRNRYNACKLLYKTPETKMLDEKTDAIAFVISANVRRRHLNANQRAMAAAKLANYKLGDNQHSQGLSIDRASKMFNVGQASTNRCRKVLSDGVSELVSLVEQNKIAASVAAKVAGLPKEKQAELVKKKPKAICEAVKETQKPTSTNLSGKLMTFRNKSSPSLQR